VPIKVPFCDTVYLLIVRPPGTVSAFQLRFVPQLDVPEAASPVGALGLVAQRFATVVTLTAGPGPDVPLLSVVSTVKA
jgi:hypothetical protein